MCIILIKDVRKRLKPKLIEVKMGCISSYSI